jgi:5-hydroxyisourate hydrolase
VRGEGVFPPGAAAFADLRRRAEKASMGTGRLTTHVLDTTHGRPAAGMRLDLLMLHDDHSHHVLRAETNGDGRLDQPLLEGDKFHLGTFELIFHVGDYFEALGVRLEAPFLDLVPIRFSMAEPAHYHVPLLVSPFGYSTYRGS